VCREPAHAPATCRVSCAYANELPAGTEAADLATIRRQADAISLHCPSTVDNARLINAHTLAACKPGVIVVNTAHGGLIVRFTRGRPSATGR